MPLNGLVLREGQRDFHSDFPLGTYYLTLQNLGSGTAVGSFHAWWEEHMPKSPVIY